MSTSQPAVDASIFQGCIPALMTPCDADRQINFAGLVRKGQEMMSAGMTAVVYCGSMGDWPLLTDQQRQQGVRELTQAGVPVIVGTGAQNTSLAAAHASHTARTTGSKRKPTCSLTCEPSSRTWSDSKSSVVPHRCPMLANTSPTPATMSC